MSAVYLCRRRVLSNDTSNLLLILSAFLLEELVGIGLCRGLRVGVVEEVLHAQKDLLDRDCRLPRLVLIKDGQTDRARGVHVGVE